LPHFSAQKNHTTQLQTNQKKPQQGITRSAIAASQGKNRCNPKTYWGDAGEACSAAISRMGYN
jgi:hypothetical protein